MILKILRRWRKINAGKQNINGSSLVDDIQNSYLILNCCRKQVIYKHEHYTTPEKTVAQTLEHG